MSEGDESRVPYERSAAVYDVLRRDKDYDTTSQTLRELIGRLVPGATSLLDVGCGTGRHLERLMADYRVEGVDLSAEMLKVAGRRCPGVPLHQGDFVEFRLDREFDVVCCLFGSIGYATTVDDLGRAIGSMARHVGPGGALIVEPWVTPERFIEGRLKFDSVDDPELAVARIYVTRREGRVSIFESDYLVGEPGGVTHFSEREELGLFTDEEYRYAFRAAGLSLVDLDPATELFGYGLYAGLRDDDTRR